METVLADAGWHNYVFVRVITEDGRTGVGEATLEYFEDVVAATVARMSDVVRGIDASRIEHIWQRLYRGSFWRGGPVLMSAISGIEQALWDLKGKAAGMPVYELLGGACRDYVELYANGPRGATPDDLASSAVRIRDKGFANLKLAAAGPNRAVEGSRAIERTCADVAAIRDAAGPAIGIAVDAHGRYSPAMVVKLAQALEPLGIWFLEEPVLPESPHALARIAAATSIPLATGALALVQPDLAHCGGIAEARRIAALAELHRAGLAPHNPMSPVNTVASAHLAMATPNFVALEYLVDDVPWRDALLTEPLDVRAGRLHLADRPGLGIELDLETCRAHPPVERPWPASEHEDGAVAEW